MSPAAQNQKNRQGRSQQAENALAFSWGADYLSSLGLRYFYGLGRVLSCHADSRTRFGVKPSLEPRHEVGTSRAMRVHHLTGIPVATPLHRGAVGSWGEVRHCVPQSGGKV